MAVASALVDGRSVIKRPHAIIVGSGPNGLTAAARLATEGWLVNVYESAPTPGGAASSSHDVFDGTIVDMGAACHPFGVASPAFHNLNLESHGLQWVHAPFEMAHPFETGEAGLLSRSLTKTGDSLGKDSQAWVRLHAPIVSHIDDHLENLLRPFLRLPPNPYRLLQFGARGVWPASRLGKGLFDSEKAQALFAGSAIHAIISPTRLFTGAFGLIFGALGMSRGWPIAKGGTQSIVNALIKIIQTHGGCVHINHQVTDLRELPFADATILNMTPHQILRIKGTTISRLTKRQFQHWKHGTSTYKVDFHLKEPVPWKDPQVGQAGTVHVGGTVQEIAYAEKEATAGRLPDRPFVMVSQQYVADPSRGPVLWSYAHVPHGYIENHPGEIRELIIRQIERFAPGFRDVIKETFDTSTEKLETRNSNLIGGDIAGGSMAGPQIIVRPQLSLRPHRIKQGLYIASSSTPPGAGVHGMSGWWAAQEALADMKRVQLHG